MGVVTSIIGSLAAAQEADRRAAYGSDVTYATNSELGFDFLRDNLATVSILLHLCVAARQVAQYGVLI